MRQLWERTQTVRSSGTTASNAGSELDPILIHALGLNLLETFRYLYSSNRNFGEFEDWIFQKNNGVLTTERIQQINAALAGEAAAEDGGSRGVEPILSAAEMEHWEEHGYVVLHDAVTPGECKAAADLLCEHLHVDLANPQTWYPDDMKATIMVELVYHPALQATRESQRIRRAFGQIWGTDNLVSTNDRCGFNPPERPGFRFPGPHLHWDTSLSPPLPLGTQGILYLTDTDAEQGAFTCVTGFHRRLESWMASLPPGANPRTQDLNAEAVPIAGKAGDLVIWHIGLPHGSRPNRAQKPRLVQYINMYPPDRVDNRPWI
ncbi:phytanoyl-CoA dioxygenase family protein [Candidatus Korobacter versatilis]|uniref:phytanoyl-CoA dioxygenase family protein n=1 Tax=Candidatus Korobacter versatilis TaxID=658062 RepID=UPI00164F6508|nr:phytanoyl-CoA dioxygenase family protein [Candidatus Koribacter versatilis]